MKNQSSSCARGAIRDEMIGSHEMAEGKLARMDVTLRSVSDRVRLTLWLLPAAFVGHDLEELFTAPKWLVAHEAELSELATRNEIFSVLFRNLASTPGAFSVAVGVVFLIFLGVTLAATIGPRGAIALRAYLAVLGAFTLHALAHVWFFPPASSCTVRCFVLDWSA
jgi:hypothetical protein